ncbi:RNA ligase [Streptomyces sp. NPDC059468]|uniref:RNA ligase n=1 Tax=Streptomyces sp. NPDC059468 TaxID=3346845 RepID=UPI0036AD728C
MTNLLSIMSPSLLQDMLDQGYVRKQNHPTEPLTIYNYTNKTQYEGLWNEVTEQTRGLIVHSVTGEVVARPFRKFYNWDQIPHLHSSLLQQPVEGYIKWDGSLGILYGLNTGEHAIASRGSFTSPQAQHATEVLYERYPTFEPILGLTYLFEIVYPENRIVVDYKDMDDLVLLAVLDTETGKTMPAGAYDWPGPVNEPLGFHNMLDVIAAMRKQDPNEEGFVVRWPWSDTRAKFKFDEYVRLHRILTNVSTLSVWDALANGQGIEEWIDRVPDEFYSWVHKVVHRLESDYSRTYADIADDYDWIMRRLRRPETDVKKRRKEFALLAQETPYPGLLFRLYDGKDISADVWKRIRPEFEKPFYSVSEDAA